MKNFVITETISYIIIKLFHNFVFGTFCLNNPIRYVNGNSLIFLIHSRRRQTAMAGQGFRRLHGLG